MSDSNLDRRRFNQLAAAAMGGMVTGAVIGCGKGDKKEEKPKASGEEKPKAGGDEKPAGDQTQTASADKHICRGLNTCKGIGADKKNDCAGQGACATVKAHDCATQNECKEQGGCGEKPGENTCKGEGKCAVPLKGAMWDKARENFEAKMKADGKEFGKAPAPKEG